MIKKYFWILILIVILVIAGVFFWQMKTKNNIKPQNIAAVISTSPTPIPPTPTPISILPAPITSTTPISISPSPNQTSTLAFPIADFKTRITKKPFGIYVTPQNSPVQPERFTGYHTGTDIEYQDVTTDVPVFAINDGTIVLARTASGYGGVIVLQTQINGSLHSIVYGHIRPSSLPQVGAHVTYGQQIGLLGTGYSSETSGERRHLHFSVLSNSRIDILGYVQTKSALSSWLDPVTLY